MSECDNGKDNFKQLEAEGETHQIEEVGRNLRADDALDEGKSFGQ